MKKIIDEGMRIPKGYGIAWRDFARDQAICYPIGLNQIVRWARKVYFWISFPNLSYWEKKELEISQKYPQKCPECGEELNETNG